ncbi:MAG: hypothetical protein WC763_00080 [Candidatus Paceibacterota bacterium]|jgi:hypothetical protein
MQGNPIKIHLPDSKSEVIVTVAFAYGFLSEPTTSFGMGHLAEHCLCAQIKENLGLKDAWGHIDDKSLVINMLLDKVAYAKLLEDGIVKTLSEIAQSVSAKIFDVEKLRIRSEVEERYNSTFSLFSEYVKGRLIKSPRRLARARVWQLKTFRKASLSGLKKTFDFIFSAEHLLFVGSSGTGKSSCNPDLTPFSRLEIAFSKKKLFRLPAQKDKGAFIIAFHTPGLEASLERGLVTGFVSGEIYEAFREVARSYGAYDPSYEIRMEREYGIVWFGLYSHAKIPRDIEVSFFRVVNSIIGGNDLGSKLKKYKREKSAEMKSDWVGREERQDWIVEDYLEGRDASSLKTALAAIDGITATKARKAAREIFTPKAAYIFR